MMRTPPYHNAIFCRSTAAKVLALIVVSIFGLFANGSPSESAIAQKSDPGPAPVRLRLGIPPGTWQGLNRNDAAAAVSTWARTILGQSGVSITVETTMCDSDEELEKDLAAGKLDCVSMVTAQFLALDPGLKPKGIYLAVCNHSEGEQYVLIVNNDSGIHELSGLKGRRLLVQSTARASLALPWLDNLLIKTHLAPSSAFLGSVTKVDKPSKVMLPVFFRQADACLMTSNAFDTACELNPQLRKKLLPLAWSPPVIPVVFFFRVGYDSFARKQLEPSIVSLHESVAGLQVLTVFQCDRMVKRSLDCLDGTREVLAPRGGAGPSVTLVSPEAQQGSH
jgi:phosphonate transport system substrate-binding protein